MSRPRSSVPSRWAGAGRRQHVVDVLRGRRIRRDPRRADRDDDKPEQNHDRQRRAQVRGQPPEETARARHFRQQLPVRKRKIRHCSILGSTAAHRRSAIRLTMNDDDHHGEHHALHDREIALNGAANDQASETGNGEHRLDHDGRRQHAIDQEADDGEQIDADVLEAVLPEDPRHRKPLGVQRPHILRRQHLQQRASQLPRHLGHAVGGDGNAGQQRMPDRLPRATRQRILRRWPAASSV